MQKAPECNYQSFLAEAISDYLDYLDHLGFRLAAPAYHLRIIDRYLAENNIDCIQQCDSRFWHGLLAQHQGRVRAKTLQNWRSTFHGLCRYLVRQGWMPENPAAAFSLPKLQHYRPYVFSIEELRRLFDWLQRQAQQSADPLTSFRFRSRYVFYHLIYACGLRVSEAVRLSTADYSPQQRTLFIQPSKFLKDRLIPIGQRVASNLELLVKVRQHLLGIPAEGPFFLLLPERRPYTRHWAGQQFRRVLRHLGIYRPKILRQGCTHGTPHLHELRRAFAVHRLMRWYREQVDVDARLPLLATYMGHSCFKYTKTYLTLTQQLLSEANHRFSGSFDRLDWMTRDPQL
ncbi:MAG: tyrosine-type recombinase/integrase [Acidobacteria bacterium]|nr:tyrosine-type recombinase/integrase [Acidobacteriota bacterium]